MQHLTDAGLLSQAVVFVVAATAPGGLPNALTVEVEVPIGDLDQETFAGTNFGLAAAEALITDAFNKLTAAAAG